MIEFSSLLIQLAHVELAGAIPLSNCSLLCQQNEIVQSNVCIGYSNVPFMQVLCLVSIAVSWVRPAVHVVKQTMRQVMEKRQILIPQTLNTLLQVSKLDYSAWVHGKAGHGHGHGHRTPDMDTDMVAEIYSPKTIYIIIIISLTPNANNNCYFIDETNANNNYTAKYRNSIKIDSSSVQKQLHKRHTNSKLQIQTKLSTKQIQMTRLKQFFVHY